MGTPRHRVEGQDENKVQNMVREATEPDVFDQTKIKPAVRRYAEPSAGDPVNFESAPT
jgi:hypothetical protein